jgi:hypothetical protein
MKQQTTYILPPCPICKGKTERVLNAWRCILDPTHYTLYYWRGIRTAFVSNQARADFANAHRIKYDLN